MKNHALIILILLVNFNLFAAEDAQVELIKKSSGIICDQETKEKSKKKHFKGLDVQSSKLREACLLFSENDLYECNIKLQSMFEGLEMPEQGKRKLAAEYSIKFCVVLAQLRASELLNTVLELSVKNKVSVDKAVLVALKDYPKKL